MNSNNIHCYCFEKEGSFYLYNYVLGLVMEVNKEFYIALCEYINCGKIRPEFTDIFTVLFDAGIIMSEDLSIKETVDTAYLSFAPVYNCNFRCKYCFGDHGNKYSETEKLFTKETLHDMLDYFFKNAYANFDKYRIDFVSGGEPLLGFNIIKDAVTYVESFRRETNKSVIMWLCTNGSMLNPEICRYLSDHNIQIGISIDGVKEKHDRNRIDINGKGTYDTIVSNIKRIKQNKDLSAKFRHLWGLSVASNDNCDFVEIINHHKELDLKGIQIKLARVSDEYDIQKICTNYDKLSEFIFQRYITKDFHTIFMILNDNDQFGKKLKQILLNKICVRRCFAGINKIVICPDGTIYPCDSFVGMPEFSIGNIYSNGKSNLFSNLSVNEREKCYSCKLKYICGGDCYYNSYINNKCISEPSHSFCLIQKQIIENCILLRYKMEMYDEHLYKKMVRRLELKDAY